MGISGPALYRHYARKYDLFRDAVLNLGQQLVDGTAFADAQPADADPVEMLGRMVDALIDVALVNRESGGLYRWHARYLHAEDRSVLASQLRVVNQRVQRPLLAVRPLLTSRERWMLSSGLLSVIGRFVDQRVRLPADDIRALLAGSTSALLAAELPKPEDVVAAPAAWRVFASNAGVYEALLHAAMVLFNERGYAETSMAQIASAAGIPGSGIYRYFSGKCEILATGLRRAADRVSGQLSPVLGALTEPRQALTLLIDAYVATSFANPELAAVYYTARVNLTPADQILLHNVQLSTIDSWVRLLTAARPTLTPTQAGLLVHAAMALVVDLGRMGSYEDRSAYTQACVRKLMEVTLFGPPASRADAVPRQPPGRRRRGSSSPSRAARR